MNKPVAIITGAGGGIGQATAKQLATRGYQLSLCGRRIDPLNATAKAAGNGLVISADVTKPDDVTALVEKTLAQLGRIDVIVNNAGIAPLLSIEQMSLQQWHQIIDTNLSAAFYLTKAVWPIFKRQGGGVVVNVSSVSARDPFPRFAAYAAAKAGLNGFSLSLAREGAELGIGVYTVAPAAVETDMFRSIMSPQELGPEKTLDPADVAAVIGQCVAGDLKFTSGEVIWMSKTV